MNSSEKLMHLSSRQLLAFLEVVRLRSISKAAEKIPMSQSGMSMLIKELEDQIGARLFDRNPRSVTLTDSGRELLPVAQRIVQDLRDLSSAIKGTEAIVQSRLHVAATPMVSINSMVTGEQPDVSKTPLMYDFNPLFTPSKSKLILNLINFLIEGR